MGGLQLITAFALYESSLLLAVEEQRPGVSCCQPSAACHPADMCVGPALHDLWHSLLSSFATIALTLVAGLSVICGPMLKNGVCSAGQWIACGAAGAGK